METLKFGNGNWATKEDSVLAYNDENNNFKPLPFDFTRASTATYVDSDGLIKTARNGEARVDYTDSTDGALLLEPARTNLVTYSEDFNQWNIYYGIAGTLTIDDNYGISPSGKQDSTKLTFPSASVSMYTSFATSGTYTSTVYIKGVSGETIRLGLGQDSVGEGTLFTLNGDWQRFENTNTDTGTGYPTINTFGGTARVVEVWGYQLEAGSYPTSYIPTSGSTVTRVADSCSQTPTTGIIGQTEGTIYTEFNFDGDIIPFRSVITLSSGASVDFVASFIFNNLFYARIRANNGSLFDVTKSNLTSGNHKLAIAYASNDLSFYLDGLLVGQNTSASVSFSSALSKIIIGGSTSGTNELGGKIKETKIYNTRLTNAELATLTT